MYIFKILFKYSEEAMEGRRVIASTDICYVIPPTGISVFIGQIIIIPLCKRIEKLKLIFTVARRKSMPHTGYKISQ